MRRSPLRADPERVREWQRRSRRPLARVRRRAEGGAAWWAARSRECRERDGWRCRRCGRESWLGAAHIVPLGIGGSRRDARDPRNALENLVTLCVGVGGCHDEHDRAHAWRWGEIGVTVPEALARRYGYREASGG